jgi:CheY-like chemotaxis protein
MNPPIRPPPKILFIHDGTECDAHVQHLTGAGLEVSTTGGDDTVAVAISVQPDIIIPDFRCDGEIMARFKGQPETNRIPVIAMAELGADAQESLDVPTQHAKAASLLPDVIAVDLQASHRDVVDMCARLRQQDSTRHIPIVAVTENGTASEIERATRRGLRPS